MKKEVKESLSKKGWSESEINKVETIIDMHNIHDKSESKKSLNAVIYWISLILIAVSHFAVTAYLFPFIVLLGKYFSLFLVAIYGLLFGFLFNSIFPHFEELDRRYHHFAVFFTAGISVINILIAVRILTFFEERIGAFAMIDPLLFSGLYIVAFIIPYIYFQLRYIYK